MLVQTEGTATAVRHALSLCYSSHNWWHIGSPYVYGVWLTRTTVWLGNNHFTRLVSKHTSTQQCRNEPVKTYIHTGVATCPHVTHMYTLVHWHTHTRMHTRTHAHKYTHTPYRYDDAEAMRVWSLGDNTLAHLMFQLVYSCLFPQTIPNFLLSKCTTESGSLMEPPRHCVWVSWTSLILLICINRTLVLHFYTHLKNLLPSNKTHCAWGRG